MKKIRQILISVNVITVFLIINQAYAIKPIYSGGSDRAAIRGYDTVAYFTENKAVPGNKEISFEHLGTTWFFSTEANRAEFEQDPEKYMPQYGGYCAYAVARGSSASSKPEYFTLHEGKLYLNFSKSVYNKWLKDKEDYIEDADDKWPSVLSK